VAEPVSEQAPPEGGGEPALARRRPDPFVPRHRFGIAYLLLAVIVGTAVGLIVVFASRGGNAGGEAWSAWKPTQTGILRLNEIAQHVASGYGLANGRQIVGVYSSPPVVQFQGQLARARAVAVASGLPGETLADAEILDAGTVWTYELCGLGKNCSIGSGSATVQRGQLLQREALELSLYTFKYEKSIDYVVTYFPTVAGKTPAAVFLTRKGLEQPLAHPLADTLQPATRRLTAGRLSDEDQAVIDTYINGAYTYSSDSLQDGSPLLVLSPISG
jgi:hypothetical protein